MLEATNASLNAAADATSDGLAREQQLKEENERLLIRLRSLEAELAASNRRVEALTEDKRSLEAAADVVRRQNVESEQCRGEIQELHAKIVTLNSSLSDISEEKKHLQDRHHDLLARVDERDRRIKSLEDERDHVMSTLQENHDKCERLYAQHESDLRSKDKELQAIHANAAERDVQSQREHESSEATIADLRQEVERLKQQLSEQLSQHELDKERTHKEIQSMLSKQKADHEQEHLQIVSKRTAEHEREKEMAYEHFQGMLSKQKEDHEQQHLQILSRQRAEFERDKERVIEQSQRMLLKERAEHEETRSRHEQLQSAYKKQGKHYNLGRPRKQGVVRWLELRPDKDDGLHERYHFTDDDQLETFLNTYGFEDHVLCVGRNMRVLKMTERDTKTLVGIWRVNEILAPVCKKDFQTIQSHDRFQDFSNLDNNWRIDANGKRYALVTAADDEDTEDETANMSVTDDEDDCVDEPPHATNANEPDMDMAGVASSSAMVVWQKQRQKQKQARRRKPKGDEVIDRVHRRRNFAKATNLRRLKEGKAVNGMDIDTDQ